MRHHGIQRGLKTLLAGLGVAICLTGNVAFASTEALTGQTIMERNDALPREQSSVQNNVLAIIRGDHKELKEFESRYKRDGDNLRMRISFNFPTKMEFLVWDDANEESQQWLKMSSGRVRKIATADRGNSWVNSDFYNEDLSDFVMEEYNFTLLGEAQAEGVDCYKVEGVKKQDEARVYDKRIFYVGKDDFVIRKIEFYENGKNRKNLLFENIELIEGVQTARKAVMERTDGSGKSILYLKEVHHNAPVADRDLTREAF